MSVCAFWDDNDGTLEKKDRGNNTGRKEENLQDAQYFCFVLPNALGSIYFLFAMEFE